MRTTTLEFDAASISIESSDNEKVKVSANADDRDLGNILNQIGIDTIISEIGDEILTKIGGKYCINFFKLNVINE